MRSNERCGVVVLGLLLIGCGEGGVQQQGDQPSMVDLGQVTANNVNIIVKCQGQQADISLVPWRRAIDSEETVTFNLRSGANVVAQVQIVPKPGTDVNSWPFDGNPITVLRGQPVTTGQSPANDTRIDVEYPYSLLATCNFGGQARDILVDPDLIVRGSGAADSL